MKKSILIVDDNPDVRFSVKLGLEDLKKRIDNILNR